MISKYRCYFPEKSVVSFIIRVQLFRPPVWRLHLLDQLLTDTNEPLPSHPSSHQRHAQYNLGVCYLDGSGVTKNDVEAVRLYRLAADQGYAQAQFYLGACYQQGIGVPKNEAEAVRWYRLAASQGHASAQEALTRIK
jgi:TPR repeat protein